MARAYESPVRYPFQQFARGLPGSTAPFRSATPFEFSICHASLLGDSHDSLVSAPSVKARGDAAAPTSDTGSCSRTTTGLMEATLRKISPMPLSYPLLARSVHIGPYSLSS